MASLVLRRLNRVPWRYPVVLGLFLVAVTAPALSERRAQCNRLIVRVALRGVSSARYAEMADAAGRRLGARARTQLIAELIETSTRIVVVTATERTLAQAFLRHAGLPDAELISSRLVRQDGRWSFAWHNYADRKVIAAQAGGIAVGDADFYTDSSSDLPLILAAHSTVLVRPTRRTLRAIRTAVPDLTVRIWT